MPVPGALADPSAVRAEQVRFPGAGGDEVDAFLARPVAAGEHPGVVVIHEAMGLNDHIRDVTRRFAGIGYGALAPDLYTREGTPPEGDRERMMAMLFAQPDERVVGDLRGALDYLHALDDTAGGVGCVGFCSGGRQTLLLACNTDRLAAAVDCWGGFARRATPDAETTSERPVPVIDQTERLACPLLLVAGAEDANPSPADVEAIAERARRSGEEVRVSVYDGAGHAFFADYRPTYRERPAHRLWEEMTAFFAEHLRS